MIVRGNIECSSLNRYQTRRVQKETGGDREAGEKRTIERGRPEPEAETSKGHASGERNRNPALAGTGQDTRRRKRLLVAAAASALRGKRVQELSGAGD